MTGRSASVLNDDCILADNQIVNVFNPTGLCDAVLSIRFNRRTKIIGNHIYQTAARQGSSSTLVPNMRGIEVGDGAASTLSGGFVIRGNWIGGTAPFCGGDKLTVTNATGPVVYFGIFLSVGATLTQVDDNHINNLDLTFRDPTAPNWYFFTGIGIGGGTVAIGEQDGNYIGSDTTAQGIILRCRKSEYGYCFVQWNQ